MDTNSGSKKIWLVIGAIVIIALAWWMMSTKKTQAPVVSDTTAMNSPTVTDEFSAELDGLQSADLNAEFQSVTADTNTL